MQYLFLRSAFLLPLTLLTSLAADTPAPSPDVSDALRKVFPALVRIHVVMEEGADGRMKKSQGSGSGTIISPEGHVLTNHHVAGRGTRFVCSLPDREEIDAVLVGSDALSDLAVLRLDLSTRRPGKQPLPVASFGNSDQLKTGDTVFAMGSPGGLSQSVTRGIVANTSLIVPRNMAGLTLDGESVGELVRWIGHDAVIFPGNSGGPLVNPDGDIVGINEVGIASLGGAIPSNLARSIASELIASGTVTRGWIGAEVQPLLRSMPSQTGALVSSICPDSPAALAGIKPGDFITSCMGLSIPDCRAPEDIPVFNALILGTSPGTRISLAGIRDGQPVSWDLTTALREPTRSREAELRDWGITARNFTTIAAREKFRSSTSGVLIDSVRSGGPASEAKPPLSPSDVIVTFNGEPISNRDSLVSLTSRLALNLTEPSPFLVEFERDGLKLASVIRIGPATPPVKPAKTSKPWLGASTQVITDDLAAALRIPGHKGVRITAVTPDSPAALAGLATGDLVFSLNDRPINARRPEDSEVFSELILACPPDSLVTLVGQRGAHPTSWSATLSPRPGLESSLPEIKDDAFEFSARQLSSAQRDLARSVRPAEPSGVLVTKSEPGGWAALGGLAPDDIILSVDKTPINGPESLESTLASIRSNLTRSVVFMVRRGARTLFLEIEPRW
jgi:serine protease Do